MQQLNADETQDGVESTPYDRFAAPILAYLVQQVSSPQDAEDLLLEVFLAALSSKIFTSLPPERQLAWLRRVARNKVVDRYRHTALLTLLPLERAIEAEDGAQTPEERAEQQETYVCLYQALGQLSSHQQELILLRYGHGLRLVDIAAMLNKPEGTVRKSLARTLHQLRKLYDQIEGGKRS